MMVSESTGLTTIGSTPLNHPGPAPTAEWARVRVNFRQITVPRRLLPLSRLPPCGLPRDGCRTPSLRIPVQRRAITSSVRACQRFEVANRTPKPIMTTPAVRSSRRCTRGRVRMAPSRLPISTRVASHSMPSRMKIGPSSADVAPTGAPGGTNTGRKLMKKTPWGWTGWSRPQSGSASGRWLPSRGSSPVPVRNAVAVSESQRAQLGAELDLAPVVVVLGRCGGWAWVEEQLDHRKDGGLARVARADGAVDLGRPPPPGPSRESMARLPQRWSRPQLVRPVETRRAYPTPGCDLHNAQNPFPDRGNPFPRAGRERASPQVQRTFAGPTPAGLADNPADNHRSLHQLPWRESSGRRRARIRPLRAVRDVHRPRRIRGSVVRGWGGG